MTRTLRKKSPRQRAKEKTWGWCSKYIRLRDCLKYDKYGEWGLCCSCSKHVIRQKSDAGHFIGRGSGGQSGVYFDESNIHIQCKRCNAFEQGNYRGYEEFMLAKYGEKHVEHLKILHKTNSYSLQQIEGLGLYYKQKYEELCKEHGL
jgi:hypothetical protein